MHSTVSTRIPFWLGCHPIQIKENFLWHTWEDGTCTLVGRDSKTGQGALFCTLYRTCHARAAAVLPGQLSSQSATMLLDCSKPRGKGDADKLLSDQREEKHEEVWTSALGALLQLTSSNGRPNLPSLQALSPLVLSALLRSSSDYHWCACQPCTSPPLNPSNPALCSQDDPEKRSPWLVSSAGGSVLQLEAGILLMECCVKEFLFEYQMVMCDTLQVRSHLLPLGAHDGQYSLSARGLQCW